MEEQSNNENMPNPAVSSRTRDDISAGVPELCGSDRLLEVESDEDDADLLNCSSLTERWSENPDISGNPLESHRSSPFCNRSSPPYLTERPSQRDMNVEAETCSPASLTEINKFATLEKGVGLENLGNTCFLNAVLQCFLHTVPLLHGILLDTHAAICHCSEEWFCVLCAMRELVELSLTFSNAVVKPWKIVNNLSYFSTSFHRFQQEDAHEFLQCFLDRLESCHDSKQNDSKHSERVNFVKQVFCGCLVSKLKCCNCDHCSDTYEPSVDLNLEVEDADNLLTALQSFTKVERIEDSENMFTCENCKEQVPVEKQLSFYQVPSVAVFHLKRFKNDGCFVEKIDKHVAFPLELDILPFTCGGETNCDELKYKLYAVVVHSGLSSTSGHYYCFIRLSPNVWCKFDDSRVVQVREDFVLLQEAYILLYAKESTPWFSPFAESRKSFIKSNILNTSPKSVLDNVSILASSPPHKSYSCDGNEASDATGSKYSEAENKEEGLKCHVSASDCFDLFSHESQKGVSPCSLEKDTPSQEVGACGNNKTFELQTPARSPSPEIYREDPPDKVFSIQHNNAKFVDRNSCKRQLDKDLDDMETRQAFSLIKKSIPGARGQQLLAALKGSKSEVSVKRKKSRSSGSPSGLDDNGSSTYQSSSMKSVLQPLTAGGFR